MSENPFIFGKPVREENFYNRKEEVEMAVSYLKKLQSFSVIGERRIGKTSFLEHILSKRILQVYGVDPKKYIVINFSMSSLHEITKDEFIGDVVERIKEQIQIEVETENSFDLLRVYIEKLALDHKYLIIALDEFEVIAPILDDSFSYWLRDIFQEPNVAAVTASQKTIVESVRPDGKPSPLYNVFTDLRLGLFSPVDTKNMIRDMFHKGGMELEEGEISFLANLSGGNPYIIQFIGFYYYEERKNRRVNHEQFEGRMLEHLSGVFDGYWKHLSEEEKKFLSGVETAADDLIGQTLERKGFIIRNRENWEISSRLFGKFILLKIERETKEGEREKIEIQGEMKRFPFARIMSVSALLVSIILCLSIFTRNAITIFVITLVLGIPLYYALGRLE